MLRDQISSCVILYVTNKRNDLLLFTSKDLLSMCNICYSANIAFHLVLILMFSDFFQKSKHASRHSRTQATKYVGGFITWTCRYILKNPSLNSPVSLNSKCVSDFSLFFLLTGFQFVLGQSPAVLLVAPPLPDRWRLYNSVFLFSVLSNGFIFHVSALRRSQKESGKFSTCALPKFADLQYMLSLILTLYFQYIFNYVQ